MKDFTFDSLNSNLILLIPDICIRMKLNIPGFKFQSDSINTSREALLSSIRVHFKFQSDSINTDDRGNTCASYPFFKFQSDSINTKLRHENDKLYLDL